MSDTFKKMNSLDQFESKLLDLHKIFNLINSQLKFIFQNCSSQSKSLGMVQESKSAIT